MEQTTQRMNLDWNKYRKEKATIEFIDLCEEFETLDSKPEGMRLKAEIWNDYNLLKSEIPDDSVNFEALYEAAKVTYLASVLFERNGIKPTEQQLMRQSTMLLSMIKRKEETIKELMSGMTIH